MFDTQRPLCGLINHTRFEKLENMAPSGGESKSQISVLWVRLGAEC